MVNRNINYSKISAYFLGFISFVIVVYILSVLKGILIPFTIAIFLTFLFHPLVEYLKKKKIPYSVSILVILLINFVLYYLIGLLIISNISPFSNKIGLYLEKLQYFIEDSVKPFNITVKELGQVFNINLDEKNFSSLFQNIFNSGIIQNLFASFSSLLSSFIFTMVFWVFMIIGKNNFEKRLKIAFEDPSGIISRSITSINQQIQSYIIIKTIISFLTGLLVTVVLFIYNIDFALMWGVITFILNFIPNVGSIIATIIPMIIAFFQYGFGISAISMSVILIVIQNVVGNILEPQYLGKHMDLSAVFVLFSLIFWGWIWGIAGMFLSVPIAAALKILFSNIEPLKPIAILLSSKAEYQTDN